MGKVGTELATSLKSIQDWKANNGVGSGQMPGGGVTPIVQLPGIVDNSQAAGVPDFGMSGVNQAQAQQMSGDPGMAGTPAVQNFDSSVPMGNPLDPNMGQTPAYDYNPYNAPKEVQERIADDDEVSDEDAEIAIKGDDWQPKHKPSGLGKFLDQILMLKGRAPAFQNKADMKNLKDAMKSHGSKDPPEMLFNRVEKFNAPLAYKMREDYAKAHARDKLIAAQEQAQIQLARRREQENRNLFAPTLKAITNMKNPEEGWQRLGPRINERIQRMGLPPIQDLQDVDMWLEGSISVDQTRDNAALEAHRRAQRGNQARNTDSLISKRQSDVSISRERLKNDIADDEKDNIRADQKAGRRVLMVPTPRGKMILSPDGLSGRIGNQIWKKTSKGNEWRLSGTVKDEE